MQIRHSYSIGSIVPFSRSTTLTTTDKNKDSSECTHILQAWPTFPDLQIQFSESPLKYSAFEGFTQNVGTLCAFRMDSGCAPAARLASLRPLPQDIHLFALHDFATTETTAA